MDASRLPYDSTDCALSLARAILDSAMDVCLHPEAYFGGGGTYIVEDGFELNLTFTPRPRPGSVPGFDAEATVERTSRPLKRR